MIKCSNCGFETFDPTGEEILALIREIGDEVTSILCPICSNLLEVEQSEYTVEEGISILKLRLKVVKEGEDTNFKF